MTLTLYCIVFCYSHRTNYYSTYIIYYSKTTFHVHLITEKPRINSALYFAVISDSVSMKILGDHLLTITYAVLSNPAVKGIAALIFCFLGYLIVLVLSASLSSSFYASAIGFLFSLLKLLRRPTHRSPDIILSDYHCPSLTL